MRAVVCLKLVVDPLLPAEELVVQDDGLRVKTRSGTPMTINGFDEQALEAALRLRESVGDLEIIALAVGGSLNTDVLKRALALHADDLVMVDDASLDTWNASRVGAVLAAAIRYIGGADLIICGRQSSDWSSSLVPFLIADELDAPCLTLAKEVSVKGSEVQVVRALGDATQEMVAQMPAVVTVTSELGDLRLPSSKDRLLAARKQPKKISLSELTVSGALREVADVVGLEFPTWQSDCQFIEGSSGAEAGAELARVLLDNGLLRVASDR